MNQSFFIGAVGAHQQMKNLNVQGNNIANVNTYGFKAERGRFASLMHTDIRAIGDRQLPVGTGAAMWTTDTDFASAATAQPGRVQDYAISGEGFFALADLKTGEISLTRNGAFQVSELQRPTEEVDENGQPIMETVMYLSDGQGRFVLSTTGGMIEVTDRNVQQPVGVFDHISYNGMEHVEGTRFLAVEKNGDLRLGTGTAMSGMLEMSNVDLAEEMTKVIESQRAYGMALKMVQTSDEIETTINNLRG